MDEQMQEQQGQEKRSYENSPWINVYDFQVTEHERQDGEGSWWDIKLASGTYVEIGGEKVDVSRYHFTTNVEPAVTHGEIGAPGTTRGIHFPEGWEINLVRFANTAPEGQAPVFVETGRIQGISPQQLADGIAERNAQWRSAHRKPKQEQDHDQNRAEKAVEAAQKRSMEYAR